jgi:hypothetical protein
MAGRKVVAEEANFDGEFLQAPLEPLQNVDFRYHPLLNEGTYPTAFKFTPAGQQLAVQAEYKQRLLPQHTGHILMESEFLFTGLPIFLPQEPVEFVIDPTNVVQTVLATLQTTLVATQNIYAFKVLALLDIPRNLASFTPVVKFKTQLVKQGTWFSYHRCTLTLTYPGKIPTLPDFCAVENREDKVSSCLEEDFSLGSLFSPSESEDEFEVIDL